MIKNKKTVMDYLGAGLIFVAILLAFIAPVYDDSDYGVESMLSFEYEPYVAVLAVIFVGGAIVFSLIGKKRISVLFSSALFGGLFVCYASNLFEDDEYIVKVSIFFILAFLIAGIVIQILLAIKEEKAIVQTSEPTSLNESEKRELSQDEVLSNLRNYKTLLDEKVISQEQFDEKKKELLRG